MWQSINDEDYFRQENTFGSTDLRAIMKSPAHAQMRLEPTPAMALGTLIHEYVLQGKEPIVEPKFDRRTKAGKEAAEEFAKSIEGKSARIVSAEHWETAQRARESVLAHPAARRALEHADTICEQPGIVAEDDFKLRVKPDARNESLSSIFELKTIDSADGESFSRSATKLFYWLQAAYYLDMANRIDKGKYESFIFFVVETSRPFGCRVFELDESAIELGREQYRHALKILKKCRQENHWPKYSDEIEILVPPAYAMYWSQNA